MARADTCTTWSALENTLRREGHDGRLGLIVLDKPKWGLVRGKRGADTVTFRAALHELGHAMGLRHNEVDNGLMNTSETIADNATTETPFPNNILWKFAADDEHRLRHWPDLVVRQEALCRIRAIAPSTTFISDRHRLDVTSASPSVPRRAGPYQSDAAQSDQAGRGFAVESQPQFGFRARPSSTLPAAADVCHRLTSSKITTPQWLIILTIPWRIHGPCCMARRARCFRRLAFIELSSK